MHGERRKSQRVELILRTERLNALRKQHDISTDIELSERIGVDVATLYRVVTGRTAPSNAFIAGLKYAFPETPLDDLLVVRTKSVTR